VIFHNSNIHNIYKNILKSDDRFMCLALYRRVITAVYQRAF